MRREKHDEGTMWGIWIATFLGLIAVQPLVLIVPLIYHRWDVAWAIAWIWSTFWRILFAPFRFFIRDHREVRSGRRSGLWRVAVVGGLLGLSVLAAGAGRIGGEDAIQGMVGLVVALGLGGYGLWWMIGPIFQSQTRRREDEHRRVQHEAQDQITSRAAVLQQQSRSVAQKRREDARAACELAYALHEPELRGRFSREQFVDFVQRYLGDDRSPEHVEQRAAQLQDVLKGHLDKVQPAPKFASLEDIAHWYQSQRRTVEDLPLDEIARQTHLAELNERYAQMTSQFLEEIRL